MMPPPPLYPPPPQPPPTELPEPISASLQSYSTTRAMAGFEADGVGATRGEHSLSYGRLSPPPPSSRGGSGMLDIRTAVPRTTTANLVLDGTGHPLRTGNTAPSSMPAGYPRYLSGGSLAFDSLFSQFSSARSTAPLPAKGVAEDTAEMRASSISAGLAGQSGAGAAQHRVATQDRVATHEPSNTQLLSLECQKRRFNPQWEETSLPNGEFQCAVHLKEHRVSSIRTFATASAAKQAIAYKAWNIVRRWPTPEAVPNAIQKVLSDMKVGGPPQKPTERDLARLIIHMEAVVGESTPPEIKTNPAAAKAYMAGFAVGSRCAGTAARGSSHERTAKDRSRSRSPRRMHTDLPSLAARYRERSASRDGTGRERTERMDRYRPASCMLPSSDNFRPHRASSSQPRKDQKPQKNGE